VFYLYQIIKEECNDQKRWVSTLPPHRARERNNVRIPCPTGNWFDATEEKRPQTQVFYDTHYYWSILVFKTD